ncbi:MAG: proline--tRNA ligase [Lentisphaeria bacterium]|nr:proline--tRNA ligase [Lentisphaeria bacterium]
MRMSKLVGRRIKETPRDATTPSHIYLIRGGYVRPVSAGIYSLLPLGKRIVSKIEAIIREEMDAIQGQEVLMPVVLPSELWEESGRFESVGDELLRFKDRNDKQMLLGMTHEEAVVQLARTELNSYKQLPAMMYQIQTKYRDEARPRAGLIRVREFTMKDAYSFHESQECLEEYYSDCHEAYVRIFNRLGFREVLSIKSDAGMMGGNVAHEFMAIADCGEDTIFVNEDGSYKANREIAKSSLAYETDSPHIELEKKYTPDLKSIEEVTSFLNAKPENSAKAVFYKSGDDVVFAVIRGDFELNEIKLKNLLGVNEIEFATDEDITAIGSVPGFASLKDITLNNVKIVMDPSARYSPNLIVGANEADYHFVNFNFERDLSKEIQDATIIADIVNARAGDPDPEFGKPLILKKGIEVGNIFQLGTKYSGAMNAIFLDQNGKSNPMIMGCYGIGVGRSMAAIVEQCHDDWGPVWPISIAPYQLQINALNLNKTGVKEVAENLYKAFLTEGIEVLYDDRNEKAGFQFKDADLIGIPYRIIVSPKTIAENQVEFKKRDGSVKEMLSISEVVTKLSTQIKEELKKA